MHCLFSFHHVKIFTVFGHDALWSPHFLFSASPSAAGTAADQPETSYCCWSAHQYYQTAAGQPRVPFHRGSRTGPLTTFQDLYL